MDTAAGNAMEPSDDLLALVDGHLAIDADTPVEAVGQQFSGTDRDFAAVCRAGRVIGLCSRSQVRARLGGRYGFALHSRAPIGEHLLETCHVFVVTTPLRDVLTVALARNGEAFLQDVVITSESGTFVGLVSTGRLVKTQTALVREQFTTIEAQRQALLDANADLSTSLRLQQDLERQVINKEKLALLDTLAGGIAHEINNKLHPIVGYAEMMIEEGDAMPADRLRRYCQLILNAGLESSRIIGQLLNLSRPPRHHTEPCDLREVVRESLTLASLRLHGTTTRLTTDLPPTPVLVLGDRAQLTQVVMNLVVNAIDAVATTSERHVRVTVGGPDEDATVEVADTGVGISTEHLSRIFDPFFTTKSASHGTGLGLGVCAAIMRQHGTEIAVVSTPDCGSRFSFVLPRHRATSGSGTAHRPSRAHSVTPVPKRVLVVDDDPLVRGALDLSLRRMLGCDVQEASDGDQGQQALQAGTYDAVLCDIRMPGMNGLDLVQWLRTQPVARRPFAVLMTGDAGDGLRSEVEASGVPVLRKPFTMAALVDLLDQGWRAAPVT